MKRLKILLLTDRLSIGGAETHLVSLCRALISKGHSVTVASSGGVLSNSIPHVTLDLSSHSPLKLIKGYFRLRSLILHERFDVIHAHARLPALIAALVTRHSKLPLLTTVHARFKLDPFRRILSAWGFRSVAVSEDLKLYLTQNYSISPENITVIENGIDFSENRKSANTLQKKSFKILFLSRLDSDCSFCAELLCTLAPSLFKRYPNLQIVLGGGGECFKKINALAYNINVELGVNVITAVGEVNDVPSFFADGDLFVGVSRSALEAISFNIPVIIAGNEGFLGRLYEDNFCYALSTNFCARGEPLPTKESLFNAICGTIDSYSRASDDAQKLYLKARSVLDISQIALRYEKFYHTSLKEYSHLQKRRAKTLLFGYYGYSNLGDDALLRAAIKRAKAEFGESVAAFTHKPRKASREFGICAYSRSSPFSLFLHILLCERLIFGGGTLFQDITSKRSLLFYIAVLRFAQLLKKDTLLYANGIGDIKSPLLRAWFLKAISRCSHIGLRDKVSFDILKKEGIKLSSAVLENDLALSLPPSSVKRADFLLNLALGEQRTSFFIVCPHAKASRFERFELDIAIRTQKNKGLTPLFISCSPDDEHLCVIFKKRYRGRILTNLSFSDLLTLFPYASSVISMRYHPLIAARAKGIFYIPIGSDVKLKEFFAKQKYS